MLWKENVISKENLNESKTFCNEVILAKCFISLPRKTSVNQRFFDVFRGVEMKYWGKLS